jgi:hypothetical protein
VGGAAGQGIGGGISIVSLAITGNDDVFGVFNPGC